MGVCLQESSSGWPPPPRQFPGRWVPGRRLDMPKTDPTTNEFQSNHIPGRPHSFKKKFGMWNVIYWSWRCGTTQTSRAQHWLLGLGCFPQLLPHSSPVYRLTSVNRCPQGQGHCSCGCLLCGIARGCDLSRSFLATAGWSHVSCMREAREVQNANLFSKKDAVQVTGQRIPSPKVWFLNALPDIGKWVNIYTGKSMGSLLR